MSGRTREELLEMLQQIERTRNIERKNELIDKFNGEERDHISPTYKLSK